MAQWDNYSQKSTPADTDTLMLKDNAATGKPNKRLLFSGLWTWIIDKLTNAVINALQTTPKTVVGGMNNLQEAVTTLNSKTFWKNQINDVAVLANRDTALTLTKSTKAFIFITSGNPAACGVLICSANSTPTAAFLPVLLGSSLSVSTNGNQLIITNSSTSVAYAYGFIVDGSGITA